MNPTVVYMVYMFDWEQLALVVGAACATALVCAWLLTRKR